MARSLYTLSLLLTLSLLGLRPLHAALVYCNITSVETQAMSNGVQITVKADGLLDYPGSSGWGTNRYETTFWNARNQTNLNFVDVSEYPVSHLELSVPQGATEGVGVKLAVAMYEPSQVSMSIGSDRQTAIITVSSTRTLEKGGKPAPKKEEKPQNPDVSVKAAEGRVSVTAVKTDLHDLLAEIGAKTGTNIIVDDAIDSGNAVEVNLSLHDLPVSQVLYTIASAYGLALMERDGIYMFSRGVTQDLAAYRLSGTSSYPLRYTRAQTASGLLPTFLYSYLHVNQGQNAVVVTAPKQMLDKISSDLHAADLATPQILIEAVACEFTDTREMEKLLQMFRGDVIGRTTDDLLPAYSGVLSAGTGDIAYANVGHLPNDFEARLRLLEMRQKARVRAAPRMAVMNGQQADLFIGVRRFIRVEVLSYGQNTEKIQGVDVGVRLNVTPLTGGGGEVTLKLNPGGNGVEVSNVSELDPRSGLPVLSTRQAGTTVRVKDGETVILGGLSQKQYDDRETKVPILGDLPLLGRLFRGHNRSEVTSDLVIFITPHLLTPEGRLADEAQEKALRERFGVAAPAPSSNSGRR